MFNDIILRTIKGEKTEYSPVWFMRQAGRYLKEYMHYKEKKNFIELCSDPKTIYEITLLPVNILKVDAAILFSDILIPLPAMGIPISYTPAPIVNIERIDHKFINNLKEIEPERDLKFVLDGIDLLISKLAVPLIGFCGSPFTIACYIFNNMIAKDFVGIKIFKDLHEKLFFKLMDILTTNLIRFLKAQINHGCKIIQIFDTWAGTLNSLDYKKFVYPYIKKITDSTTDAFKIYFIKNATPYYEFINNLNIDVLSVDWRQSLSEVNSITKNRFILQGNMDPYVLLTNKENAEEKCKTILDDAKSLKGHIFNLGHGIYPNSDVKIVKHLVNYVKSYTLE
ncbi:MAG: uroporphyrinogen decarboxylase [Deferribacterota bacterium]|nr:uroporphyrinogen decarboxylase [Deferribacterota bacterium]